MKRLNQSDEISEATEVDCLKTSQQWCSLKLGADLQWDSCLKPEKTDTLKYIYDLNILSKKAFYFITKPSWCNANKCQIFEKKTKM